MIRKIHSGRALIEDITTSFFVMNELDGTSENAGWKVFYKIKELNSSLRYKIEIYSIRITFFGLLQYDLMEIKHDIFKNEIVVFLSETSLQVNLSKIKTFKKYKKTDLVKNRHNGTKDIEIRLENGIELKNIFESLKPYIYKQEI